MTPRRKQNLLPSHKPNVLLLQAQDAHSDQNEVPRVHLACHYPLRWSKRILWLAITDKQETERKSRFQHQNISTLGGRQHHRLVPNQAQTLPWVLEAKHCCCPPGTHTKWRSHSVAEGQAPKNLSLCHFSEGDSRGAFTLISRHLFSPLLQNQMRGCMSETGVRLFIALPVNFFLHFLFNYSSYFLKCPVPALFCNLCTLLVLEQEEKEPRELYFKTFTWKRGRRREREREISFTF